MPHLFSTELWFAKRFLSKCQAFSSAVWYVAKASTALTPARRFSVICCSTDGSQLPRSTRPAKVRLNCHGLGRAQSNVNGCSKILLHHEAILWVITIGHSYMGVSKLRCSRLVLSSAIFIAVFWLVMPETVPFFCNSIVINSYSIYMQIFLCKLEDVGTMKRFWWKHLALEEQMSTRCLNLAEPVCLFA